MYGFIFGFHRLVWWPKWTPASSRSFIGIAFKLGPLLPRSTVPGPLPLSLAELEALAGAGHAVLLAFLGAWVARHQPRLGQLRPQLPVVDHQRPRDAEP